MAATAFRRERIIRHLETIERLEERFREIGQREKDRLQEGIAEGLRMAREELERGLGLHE